MLFTPKRRSRCWYKSGMITLYSFHILFGISTIYVAIVPSNRENHDKVISTLVFLVLTVSAWLVGKAFSNIVYKPGPDRRRLPPILKRLY